MNPQGPARATTQGVAADNVAISARRPRALVTTALRSRSVYSREILAEAAWPGHPPEELEGWFVPDAGARDELADPSRRPGAPRDLPPGSNVRALADYARVLSVQLGTEGDRARARAMLEALARTEHWPTLHRSCAELLAQLRVLSGDVELAVQVADDERVRAGIATSVRADALHPRLAPGADPQAWADAFNRALHSERMAPILAPPPGQLPNLDRLQVEARPQVAAPLRVTVMMSTYRPGPALLTAVSSVLAQTWANLELFVVDDASGPGPDGSWASILDQVEAMDERVHVIRKAVNGGTYRARNTVLRRATGDLGIVCDSDDWWHPQTLELGAARLLRSSRILATRSQGVRVTPDLRLTRPGYVPRFESAATVLFRLRPVLSRIGFYDPTRKGADTEYTRRLVATFGPVLHDLRETTTLLRAGEDTLSAQEFSNGWRHPVRHQYKALYTPWHEQISQGRSDPYLDPDQPRRFSEPLRWARATHPLLEEDHHVDLVLAGDWRRFGGPQRSMLEEIRAAREAGLRVGVMHLEALRFMTPTDETLCEPLLDLVRRGEVTWVQADDDVDIEVLLVRYPPILQYPPRISRPVRARHVLVMANQGPLERDGADQRYVVRDVSSRATELFGRPVRWVPQSPTIRRVLLEQDPEVALTDWDNPGLIDLDAWAVRPLDRAPAAEGRPIVVGRHSRDARIKFPTTYEELVRGYSFPSGYEVRMLGATGTVDTLREEDGGRLGSAPLPDNWTLLPHRTQEVQDFLAGLDFFLYLDNPDAHEAFGRTLLEAAASGVLTIAHPKHRPTFGDALDYAEPGQAQALIARYAADPEAYRARVESTRAAVADRYGHRGFVERLRPLLGARPADPDPDHQDQIRGQRPDRQSGPDQGVAGPLQLQLERPARSTAGNPDHDPRAGDLGRVRVEGAQVEHLTLRSAADGERADGAVIVHDDLPTAALRTWLSSRLQGTTAPDWEPTALLDEAPLGVRAVLVARDGIVLAAGRGSWRGLEPDEELIRLAGARPLSGWSQLAWSVVRPPRTLTLQPPAVTPTRADAPSTDLTDKELQP